MERKSSFLGLLNSDAVGVGSCNKPGSKSWVFNFIDKKHITLSINDKCLSRGNKKFKNALSMKSCASGTQNYLVYHPTALHENGFYLKAADESCFDGEKFRPCSGKASNQLLWGVGVKFVWGEAKRYLYSFSIAERGNCLVGRGSTVSRGIHSSKYYCVLVLYYIHPSIQANARTLVHWIGWPMEAHCRLTRARSALQESRTIKVSLSTAKKPASSSFWIFQRFLTKSK